MIAKGEAYIIMLKRMQVVPTMAERFLKVWTLVKVIKVRTEIKISSNKSHRRTLSLFFPPE